MTASANSTAGRLARHWDALFFPAGSALNLAMARIFVAATALWVVLSRDLPATSGLPQAFWSGVTHPMRWRYLLFPGHESLERVLQGIAIVALILTLVGVWPRICSTIAGLLLYHLAPLETIFWNPNPYLRGLTIPVLALLALCASPCGNALALWRPASQKDEAALPWEYAWPVRFIQMELCFIYLFSGYSKLVDVGLLWLSPEFIRLWLVALGQNLQTQVFHSLGPWLAEHLWLCGAMGAGSLLLELAFPAVLFSRTAKRVLVPAAFLMHVGIMFAFNITILFLPLFVVFVNWAALGKRRATREGSAAVA